MSAIYLCTPKFAHNVGGVVRAAANFDVPEVYWTGTRVRSGSSDIRAAAQHCPSSRKHMRLPREERMADYRYVHFERSEDDRLLDGLVARGMTPVCVELLPGAESLPAFQHPDDPVYVFGPEDGSVPKGIRQSCHRFVQIPTKHCLNLAAAVNVVLYDRAAKNPSALGLVAPRR